MINDDVIQKIVVETNSFAAQEMFSKSDIVSLHARIKKWYVTDPYEIEDFFSLLIWSGLVSLPSYELYWSTSGI